MIQIQCIFAQPCFQATPPPPASASWVGLGFRSAHSESEPTNGSVCLPRDQGLFIPSFFLLQDCHEIMLVTRQSSTNEDTKMARNNRIFLLFTITQAMRSERPIYIMAGAHKTVKNTYSVNIIEGMCKYILEQNRPAHTNKTQCCEECLNLSAAGAPFSRGKW